MRYLALERYLLREVSAWVKGGERREGKGRRERQEGQRERAIRRRTLG